MDQKHNSSLKFSPDGKLLAIINEHGILKIWDTETNKLAQEFTPNLHLSHPFTCLTWLTVVQKNSAKKGKKSANDDGPLKSFYLALGTNKGGISLYSYSEGKIEKNFQGDGHNGSVAAITYDNSNTLYSVGEDCLILAWNIFDECKYKSWQLKELTNEKPCSILYLSESENLLIGARQIILFSLKNEKSIQTFTGHSSDVTLMDVFTYESTNYAITASNMERILCLWTLSKKFKHKNVSCTFLMEDIANYLSCKMEENIDEQQGSLKIVAVTRSGRIHIFFISMDNIKPEKPIKPKVTIELATDTSSIVKPLTAIAASPHFNCKSEEIFFGYGDNAYLIFEKIALDFSEKLQILTRNDPKQSYLKNKKKQDQESVLKTITPFVNTNDVEYNLGNPLHDKKKQKPVQMPMEVRLKNLHLSNGEIPQAQSKVQLLIQALHSKDAQLLFTVLSTKDPKVIQLTVQKLPIQYIEPLVNELTLLMQKKRSNVQIAAIWLRILIKTHTSQLMAVGANDLLNKFGPCLGIIEHRISCLTELSKLNGRLQLLINQIKRNEEEEEILYNENVLIYEDRDSTSSDNDEDIFISNSDNGDEWQEDESDNNDDEDEKMEMD